MPGRPRILVVDDEAPIRHLLLDLLADEGYDPIEAANGRVALAVIRQHRPDLVPMDVMMPELDGRAVLRALRAEPELADMPVVLMSAAHGIGAHAEDTSFLPKPFDLDQVLAVVRRTLLAYGERS
jgi:CheY-like chemotaxis protein